MHKNKFNLKETMNFSNFDTNDFLKNYWEKKPLVIKNAVPDAETLAERDDFIQLACDEDFESRLIIQDGGDYPWQLKEGPFTEEQLLNNKRQTLICHRINLLHQNFFDLAQQVRFLPNWQFDDIMATVSNKNASCGAHIDNYNVFIIQGQGKRHWTLQSNPNPEYIEGLDIRLLKEFNPDMEVILEPGDMLYIPPKVAHLGISADESISYSIGFKALEYANLIDFYTSFLMQTDFNEFYSNPQQESLLDPFKLEKKDIDKIKEDFINKTLSSPMFEDVLCSYLSRATAIVEPQTDDAKEVAQRLDNNEVFTKDQSSQFLYYAGKLYCNSIPFQLEAKNYQKIRPLIASDLDAEFNLTDFNPDEQLKSVLTQLLLNGDLYFL